VNLVRTEHLRTGEVQQEEEAAMQHEDGEEDKITTLLAFSNKKKKSSRKLSLLLQLSHTVLMFRAVHANGANIFIPGHIFSLPGCHHFPP